MVDYVKILISSIAIEELLRLLDFKYELSENTGEISNKQVAEYHGCKVTIYDSGVILFTGSIHKMWNSLRGIKAPNYNVNKIYKGFNGNQFSIEDILEVRSHLVNLFKCTPEQMLFQNIEFGINSTPSFNPQIFIKGLLYHNGKIFEYRYKEHYAQVVHQRYLLKIYNKSNQYGMDEHTLRIEIKVIKTEEIKHIGIKTFADINTINLNKAFNHLLKRFDEVVYYDYTIRSEQLTKRQNQSLERYSNPRYWIHQITPKKRTYHKEILKAFIDNYSNKLYSQIACSLNQKFDIINRHSERSKFDIINHSNIELEIPNSSLNETTKICPITNVDISMQKTDSFLLSNTGLKYLKEHDEELFSHLASVFLTGNANKFEKNIYSRIAKQIRNKYFSNRSLFTPDQVRLFS